MGICISFASKACRSRRVQVGHENTKFSKKKKDSKGTLRLGSLCSKEGSKGLNQDTAILFQGCGKKDSALCGVFDGHGKNGHIVSEIVRNHLPALIKSRMKALPTVTAVAEDGDLNDMDIILRFNRWKEAFVSSFRVMDKAIKLQENLDCSCSGTTAVVVIRQGEDLFIANLGDSRAVLGTVTENGIEGIQLTTDQKPGLPSEAERIRACNGRVVALMQEPHIHRVCLPHEDSPGLAMSRAFGDYVLKDHGVIAIPSVSHRRLTSEDKFIVLATDGVWDVLSNNEVASIVWEADSAEAAAKAVIEAATASWRKKFPASRIDDCTVVCLFFSNKAT